MAGKRRKFPRWRGSEEKPPRNPRIKLGDIMGGNFLIFGLCSFGSLLLLSSFNAVPFSLIRLILNKRAIEASVRERPVLYIRTGDVLEIKLEVPENRRRLSIYKGMVISKQNANVHTTIRIRRIIAGVGVEIVFPVCRHCQS